MLSDCFRCVRCHMKLPKSPDTWQNSLISHVIDKLEILTTYAQILCIIISAAVGIKAENIML